MIEFIGLIIKGWAILAVILGCVGALLGLADKIKEEYMMIAVCLGMIGGLILVFGFGR